MGRAPLECGQEALADLGPVTSIRSTFAARTGSRRCTGRFDHEPKGVRNDVLTEPQVDVEYAADDGRRSRGGRSTPARRSPNLVADTPTTAGALALGPPPTPNLPCVHQTITYTPSLNETNAISNPTTVTANCRVFLSAPLEAPVHISGTPVGGSARP